MFLQRRRGLKAIGGAGFKRGGRSISSPTPCHDAN